MCDGKKIDMGSISFGVKGLTVSDEALPLVKKPFSLFCMHILQRFDTILREVLTETGLMTATNIQH